MVRVIEKRLQPDDINYFEFAGLSTDTKPTNCCTGSKFTEADTGDVYLFDETSETWTKA